MTRLFAIFIFLFTLLCISVDAQERPRDLIIREAVKKHGQAEVTIQYPGRHDIDLITRKVSIISIKDKTVYISLSSKTIEWFIGQNFDYRLVERSESKGLVTAADVNEAMDWQTYPSYSDYLAIMQAFESAYPGLCQLDTIGTSINGKLILVLKISDNVSVDEDEPEVFYSSTMHGDELVGYVLMLRLADSLLTGYLTSDRIRNMVDNMEIWINPLANPDGTYNGGNTITAPTRYNAHGEDLNRNFPDPLDLSIVPGKETVDMMKFMRDRRFVISANFHSGVEVLNYPWDRWFFKFHADDSWFINICRAYADTIHKYFGTGYMTYLNNGVTRGSDWYVIYGGRQDFITWELQGREVTIELDFTKETPAAQLELHWQYNRRSLLSYLENALSGVHGVVKDLNTGSPVPARVYVKFHDKDSSHVYADTLTGKFVRLLYPAPYNLYFTANGYRDTTINSVQVVKDQITELTVHMQPVSTAIDNANPDSPLLYPIPVETDLKCLLPENMTGNIEISIFDQAGRMVFGKVAQYSPGIPLSVNVTCMSAGIYFIYFRNSASGLLFHSRFVIAKHSY